MKNIALGFVVILAWMQAINQFLGWVGALGYPLQNGSGPVTLKGFVLSVIVAPIWEELVYRHAPMLIVRRIDPTLAYPVAIISSALFGYMHGGIPGLFLQGGMGMVFCWVYVKNGWSYWSSVVTHAMWNLFVEIM